MVTKQQKLEWLARNVHEWPSGVIGMSTNGVQAILTHSLSSKAGDWFEYKEWLSMREKLQNKPSWSDVPEWAEWIAQSGIDGWWEAYAGKPTPRKKRKYWSHHGYIGSRIDKQGEILGDWRDTLEAMPLAIKINKPKAGVIINQTWKGAMKVAITAQDSSRHELRVRPSVGAPSELWFGGSFAYNCEFICVRGHNYIVWNLDADRPDCADIMNSEFRPLRTEREKAIDDLVEIICRDDDLSKDGVVAQTMARRIYDAGYRKEQAK